MDHERVGEIINIFACAWKMQVLFEILQSLVLVKFLFQKVFDSFDVVVGYLFYFFNSISVGNTEVVKDQV